MIEKLKQTRFFSKLNKYWKTVRNMAAILSTVLTSLIASEYFQLIEPDEVLFKVVKYALFISGTIVLVAQNTKE